MIYLNNNDPVFYIPKSQIKEGGENIRFINGFTKDVLDVSVYPADIYYRLTDVRVRTLKDGQYVYEIYDDDVVYDSGVAQKGMFTGPDTSIYNQNLNFIQYEG